MNRFQKWLLVYTCLMFSPAVLAESMDGGMPSVLLHDAKARGCNPIKGFFDRDGITLPPFFFDEQSENREYTAAYVCERKKQYFLVLLAVDSGSTCKQRELGLGRTMPGGLEAFPRRLPLSTFRTLDNTKLEIKSSDASKSTHFRPLVIDYDGVQRVFYCNDGQWLETRFD